jgi:hypothetical protein
VSTNTSIAISAVNPSTNTGVNTGAALSISGAVKVNINSISATDPSTTTWFLTGTAATNGTFGVVRLTGANAGTVNLVQVSNTAVGPNSVIIITMSTAAPQPVYQATVTGTSLFQFGLQTGYNFSAGEGFNYWIVNQ